jgi:hypothetical protein
MEELVLKADLDETSSIYISPIDRLTYDECIGEDNLGGEDGYFVMLSRRVGEPRLEVLAKAPNVEAAVVLFDMVASKGRR